MKKGPTTTSSRIWNWGIVGPGRMAEKFASDLKLLPDARIHAVASRSLERAAAFARRHDAEHVYGCHEEIAQCPNLDVVYIATPHVLHHANTLHCLRNGTAVLCEKPWAMNARQAAEMVTAARDHQVFLMEALWTRFLPTITTAMTLIEQGSIGDLLSVKADFGFPANPDTKHRLFDPALGGGALLDIGIYPVFLALLLLGRPTEIHAAAQLGHTGVDEEIGVVFSYPNGRLAHLQASIRSRTRTEAFIYGSTGTLHIHTPWHGPSAMSLLREGEPLQAFHFDYKGEGYYLEAAHVMDCLDRQQKESELLPLDFSLQLSGLLDAIRQAAGIRYPGIDHST